ncbi:hypothetical protein ACQ4PT_026159 [Festuca glaucescens]
MEEEAAEEAMRAPKRRRSVGDDGQHVPPGGGSGEEQETLDGLDLISRLPDEVLGTVISLLPTKDGARTQLLSRRWLPLWRSPMAPLNLAVVCKLRNKHKGVTVVSKILSDHRGPARRFSILLVFFHGIMAVVDGYFCSATLAGLQELEVTNLQRKRYPLPPPALTRFAPTLRVLKLDGCQFCDRVTRPSFPHLKQLILYNVGISEDSLQCMISACAVLESLSLRGVWFARLCISSPTLRSINLQAFRSKCEMVIEDAPCLERLLPNFPNDGPTTMRVIRAPKLEILGFLSEGISTLHLGTAVFQKMIAISLTTKMHTMKILALDSIGSNLDAVVDFLKCFPCLEKLYVILHPQKDTNNLRKYDPLDPVECLELHLKKVVLKNYDGNKRSPIDFVKFFILNAKVLREMEIGVLYEESDEWMCYQHRQLQVENRASRDAQIELRSDTYARPTNHWHTHGLSMADPFDKCLRGYVKSVR